MKFTLALFALAAAVSAAPVASPDAAPEAAPAADGYGKYASYGKPYLPTFHLTHLLT
jgi:hypothetical protein